MTKSKIVIEKIAKLLEQGLVSYKDLSSEILNIIKSKKIYGLYLFFLQKKIVAKITPMRPP